MKSAAFWLSCRGPTPERAQPRQTRPPADHDASACGCDAKRQAVAAGRSGFTGEPVCTPHTPRAWMSPVQARPAHPSQSPELWPLTRMKLQSHCPQGAVAPAGKERREPSPRAGAQGPWLRPPEPTAARLGCPGPRRGRGQCPPFESPSLVEKVEPPSLVAVWHGGWWERGAWVVGTQGGGRAGLLGRGRPLLRT